MEKDISGLLMLITGIFPSNLLFDVFSDNNEESPSLCLRLTSMRV